MGMHMRGSGQKVYIKIKVWVGICVAAMMLLLCKPAFCKNMPSWIPNHGNSKYIVFGGPTIIEKTNGITLLSLKCDEGDISSAKFSGVSCAQSIRADNGQPGMFYFVTEPWDKVNKWLGRNNEILLTIHYFDRGPGRFYIQYDSSDPRVKYGNEPAGAWRYPDEFPNGVVLKGDKKWKTVSMRLKYAFFTKRCNGGDIRINPQSDIQINNPNANIFALAGVAISRVPAVNTGVPVTQNLRVEKSADMTSFGTGARFTGTFVQRGSEPIVMEAVLASSLDTGGHEPNMDASGNAYIDYVNSALWTFTVTTAGRYVMWERAYFPWKGGWNHTEDVDGAGGIVMDGNRGPDEGWQWLKGREYNLVPGTHTFHMTYMGGARLNVLVLSQNTKTPPDTASMVSSYHGPVTGEVWTAPIYPFDVKKWDKVTFNISGSTKRIVYEVSTDNGVTWKRFNPQTGLAFLPILGGGKDSLMFHIIMQGIPGKYPPFFRGGEVQYTAGSHNFKTIENSRVRMEIDPYGIKSIYDKKAGAFISQASALHDALVSLLVKKPGFLSPFTQDLYNGTLDNVAITRSGKNRILTMNYTLSCGIHVRITMNLHPDGQMEWRLKIDNPTKLEVAEIRFPVINGISLGKNPKKDWIAMFKSWGQVWQDPAKDRLTTVWGTAMRWAMIWDNKQGLYEDIEDPQFNDYGFVYGGDSSGGETLSPCERILVRPGKSWTSGIYRIAVTGGDWHQGADIYRKYVVKKELKSCKVPQYVKWLVDAWCGQNSNSLPVYGWDAISPTGFKLMAANRQMLDGADSGYCGLYPYLCLTWGSSREFSQKLAVRRALGGFYTPYLNFYLWAPGYGYYSRIGTFSKTRLPKNIWIPGNDFYTRNTIYSFTGDYAHLKKSRFAQTEMAIASRGWRKWLMYWTEKYLDWGADGMYYDQLNFISPDAGLPGRLYHGFDTYGNWMPATLDALAKIKKASLAKDPYYTSSGEFANDVYGQYLDLRMTSGVLNRLEFYRYCDPDQILIDGGWNGGLAERFGGYERERFIWQVGARFEQIIGPNGAYNQDDPVSEKNEWPRRVLNLRRAVKSLLYDSRFMDTVGLTVRDAKGEVMVPEYTYDGSWQNAPFRGVIGRWFLYNKGQTRGAVVNMINFPVQKGATVTLNTKRFGPVTAAEAWTFDGKCFPVHGTQDGNLYTFPVPESEMSSIVLSNVLPPVVEWSFNPVSTPGLTRSLTLKITNINAKPMSGTAELRLPEGWAVPDSVKFGPVAPYRTITVEVPVTVSTSAKINRRYDVFCDIQTGQGIFTTYNFVVVNNPVIADFRGNPGSYHVWLRNLSSNSVRGSLYVNAPFPLQVSAPSEFTIAPDNETDIPVTVTGRDRLNEISQMKAVLYVNGKRIEVVRGVMPVVPNGDFEMDSAGDKKPDWWMTFTAGDQWAGYRRIHLVGDAHRGRYCLRIDAPQKNEKFIYAFPEDGAFNSNTRYHVSIWIKSNSPEGVYAKIGPLILGQGKTTNKWQKFTGEFLTGKSLEGGYGFIGLYNSSNKPVFFDDLKIVKISNK